MSPYSSSWASPGHPAASRSPTPRASRPRSTSRTARSTPSSSPAAGAQLGARLIASGDLSPEALTSALDVQTNELQGWRLGELLVHLGYVERAVVEAFVVEQLRDAMAALLEWPVAAHKFRKTKKTRQDVAPPMTVRELLSEVEMRRHRWS